jgi:ATP/ADP translocase
MTSTSDKLRQLFFLEPGDFKRLGPFFLLYFLLFVMLNMGDGLSVSMFVQKVGALGLPVYYGVTALLNIVLVGGYMVYAPKLSNKWVFCVILMGSMAAFLGAWFLLLETGNKELGYGAFFVARELAFTLVIMHFGTYLQDYFSRTDLNRLLPIIYSGGRLGGIVGGALLGGLVHVIGTTNMMWVFLITGLFATVILFQIPSAQTKTEEQIGLQDSENAADKTEIHLPDSQSQHSSFQNFFKTNPLLFWMSLTTIQFILCRWILNFQYNQYFEHFFSSQEEMASFMGWYTAIALTGSLLIQLFVINRVIHWIGLKGAHFVFTLFLLLGMGLNLMPMGLKLAIFSRLLETEFRVGFRNPVHILLTNQFPREHRTRARAWLMGMVMPLGTLLASLLLMWIIQEEWVQYLSMMGASLSLIYFLSSFGLYKSFEETPAQK